MSSTDETTVTSTGLVKQKKYDWKDSNLALFGSDTEKNIKKESAECEPAWDGTRDRPGLRVWRVVQFEITDWPEEHYGEFYNGDTYIVLKAEQKCEEMRYDVHFWIGKYSTQDEYCTAAYKTNELDCYLDDKAIQHREVQGNESKLFKSYFESITILKGGAESGFNHVTPEEYKPRLLQFTRQKRRMEVLEVSMKKSNMAAECVYLIDYGQTVYQWNGALANKDEKFEAAKFLYDLKGKRGGNVATEVVEEAEASSGSHECFKSFPVDENPDKPRKAKNSGGNHVPDSHETTLLDACYEDNELVVHEVAKGANLKSRDVMDSSKVYIVDTGRQGYIWIGKETSCSEKKNGHKYAKDYLQTTSNPYMAYSVINEDKEPIQFRSLFRSANK